MTKETTRDPAQKLESKWQKILKEFGKNPRDVQTIPKINRPGRWFYVVALMVIYMCAMPWIRSIRSVPAS